MPPTKWFMNSPVWHQQFNSQDFQSRCAREGSWLQRGQIVSPGLPVSQTTNVSHCFKDVFSQCEFRLEGTVRVEMPHGHASKKDATKKLLWPPHVRQQTIYIDDEWPFGMRSFTILQAVCQPQVPLFPPKLILLRADTRANVKILL